MDLVAYTCPACGKAGSVDVPPTLARQPIDAEPSPIAEQDGARPKVAIVECSCGMRIRVAGRVIWPKGGAS